MRTVVIVDAKNLLYRAHFAHPDLTSSSGDPTSILFGVPVMLLDASNVLPQADVVVVWEGTMAFEQGQRVQTPRIWRKDYDKAYKANRVKDPKMEIAEAQFPELYRFLSIIGWPQLRVHSLEADDVIGVLSAKLAKREDVGSVIIYSRDSDFHQLLRPKVFQLLPSNKGAKIIGHEDLEAMVGIAADKFLAMRCLAGDSTDNIKPIPGVGEKTAIKMLKDGVDPTLESWDDHPAEVKLRYTKLSEHWDSVQRARVLCRIPRKINYPFFPAESQNQLREQIEPLLYETGRSWTKQQLKQSKKAFREFCEQYDMEFVLSQEAKFFGQIKVK